MLSSDGVKGGALSEFRRNLLVADGGALAIGDDAGAHLTDLMKGKSDGNNSRRNISSTVNKYVF